MQATFDPLFYFPLVFVLSAAAGATNVVMDTVPHTYRRVIASGITTGLLGVAVSMWGWEHYPDLRLSFIAFAIVIGLAGWNTFEFFVRTFRSFGRAWIARELRLDDKDKHKEDDQR